MEDKIKTFEKKAYLVYIFYTFALFIFGFSVVGVIVAYFSKRKAEKLKEIPSYIIDTYQWQIRTFVVKHQKYCNITQNNATNTKNIATKQFYFTLIAIKVSLSQIIFPRFKKYHNIKANLLFYLDLCKSPGGKTGYYYRALFECNFPKKTDKFFLIELIPVELLPLIPSGNTYIFERGKIIEILPSASLQKITTKISIPEKQRLEKLSLFIPEAKLKKFGFLDREGNYVSFAKEIGNQNVLRIEIENKSFLIPSTFITSRFYFFSSRIISYVWEGSLERAHKGLSKNDKLFKIILSSYISSADAPKIVYFETNDYGKKALSTFSRVNRTLLMKSSQGRIPIYAYFPFYGEYFCEISYETIENYAYVHFLTFKKGTLPWEKMDVEVIRISKEKNETENNNINSLHENFIPLKIPEEIEGSEYSLIRAYPSKYLKTFGVRTKFENESMRIKRGLLSLTSTSEKAVKFSKSQLEVQNLSFEDKKVPFSEQERRTAKLEVASDSSREEDYEKSIEKFRELVRLLQKGFKFKVEEERELFIPVIFKKRNAVSQLEFYDWENIYKGKNPSRRRKFLMVIGTFSGFKKRVCFIEIDQKNMSYSVSTFLLIFNGQSDPANIVKLGVKFLIEFLKRKGKDLLEKWAKGRGFSVYFKKHPSVWSDRAKVSWCRRVVEVVGRK